MSSSIQTRLFIVLASTLMFVPATMAGTFRNFHRRMAESESSASDITAQQEVGDEAAAVNSEVGEPIPVKKTPERRAQRWNDYYYYHGGGKKGGGGKGKKNSGGGDVPQCQVISVFALLADLESSYFQNSVGDGFNNLPFYDSYTGDYLGTYSEASIDTAYGTDESECVYTAAWSFDYVQADGDGDYLSQINTAATCYSAYDSITGGSGAYGCAQGYSNQVSEDDTTVTVHLNLCTALCPAYPNHHYHSGW